MIAVSAIVTTYNEENNLVSCLKALKDFNEIIVVDSNSTDKTQEIARDYGVRVENFTWNETYPKKRQWCLDHIQTKHDFIFFVDGDEVVTLGLVNEIKNLNFNVAGYFTKGQYVWNDRVLKYGLMNNKLCLFNKHKIEFPVIDDLDIDGMGEMEGHYQPILKFGYRNERIKTLEEPLLHYAYKEWQSRHERYAVWEAQMIARDAYPTDPIKWRETLKKIFRHMPLRGLIAFLHSYIWKLGFLDGAGGYDFAKSRAHYYSLVSKSLKHQ